MLTRRKILIKPIVRPGWIFIPQTANPLGYIRNLDKGVDCPSILSRLNVTLNGGIEHSLVGGIIDRLSVVVMHLRVPTIISDEISVVDGEVGSMCPTRPDNPGVGIVTTGRGSIEHLREV
jgi:hypothetical protein